MADQQPTKPSHLEPSELGTKQYWDALYTTELTNHAANPADEGTVWFDDSDAEAKVVEFLAAHALDSQEKDENENPDSSLRLDRASTTFLDLGCGNGSLLFALRDAGWTGRLLGVDYSERSVALARQIQTTRAEEADGGTEEQRGPVDFVVWDVLNGPLDALRAREAGDTEPSAAAGWDVVLDKGTFDAVSLSGERDGAGRRISEGYRKRVLELLRPGGVFVVTSCNWTETELEGWFAPDSLEAEDEAVGRLRRAGRVQYRTFSFGGIKGQTISTLCFQKAG